jgi:ketosteroid isomerase-like protein
MPHDYAQTVRSFYDATFKHHDAQKFKELVDPGIEWTSAENMAYADHSPYIGVDSVADLLFRRLPGDWDNFTMHPGEILGRDDLVIASGRFQGIFKANGVAINAQFVQVFQFKDGKIAKVQNYTDTAQFKESISQLRAGHG